MRCIPLHKRNLFSFFNQGDRSIMKYLCYPVNMQVGRLVGRCFGLMFDVDDHQCRGGSFPAHRFPREKGKADGWGRVDLTAGGYMVGQFAFGFSAFLLSDTEALSVERRTVGLRFRRFLRGAIHKLRYATFFFTPSSLRGFRILPMR